MRSITVSHRNPYVIYIAPGAKKNSIHLPAVNKECLKSQVYLGFNIPVILSIIYFSGLVM